MENLILAIAIISLIGFIVSGVETLTEHEGGQLIRVIAILSCWSISIPFGIILLCVGVLLTIKDIINACNK